MLEQKERQIREVIHAALGITFTATAQPAGAPGPLAPLLDQAALLLPGLPVAGAVVKAALGEHFRLGQTALVPSYDLTGPSFGPAMNPSSDIVSPEVTLPMSTLLPISSYGRVFVARTSDCRQDR